MILHTSVTNPKAIRAYHKYITVFTQKHSNKYLYNNAVYYNANTPITVTCPIHGDFKQTPNKHAQGQGCKKCATKTIADTQRKPLEQFIEEAINVHNGKYSYEKAKYISNKKNLIITCPTHGDFEQSPAAHICNKQGCPKCANESQGFTPEKYAGKPAIFYVLELQNGLFKPGITTQKSVEKRYNQDNYTSIVKTILFQTTFKDGKEARQFEIDILKQFQNFKFKGSQVFPKVKNTEILTINPVETILKKLITSDGQIMSEMSNGNMEAYKLDNK